MLSSEQPFQKQILSDARNLFDERFQKFQLAKLSLWVLVDWMDMKVQIKTSEEIPRIDEQAEMHLLFRRTNYDFHEMTIMLFDFIEIANMMMENILWKCYWSKCDVHLLEKWQQLSSGWRE